MGIQSSITSTRLHSNLLTIQKMKFMIFSLLVLAICQINAAPQFLGGVGGLNGGFGGVGGFGGFPIGTGSGQAGFGGASSNGLAISSAQNGGFSSSNGFGNAAATPFGFSANGNGQSNSFGK